MQKSITHAVHKVVDAVRSSAKKQKVLKVALKLKIVPEMKLDASTLNQHLQNLFNEAGVMNGEEKYAPFSGESAIPSLRHQPVHRHLHKSQLVSRQTTSMIYMTTEMFLLRCMPRA